MDNKISFKSRINFVDAKTFIRVANGIEVNHIHNPIEFADEFYTTGVKTCSAGAAVIPHKTAYGFHTYDCENTNKTIGTRFNIDLNLSDEKPKRALIIGSKKRNDRPFSPLNFNLIKRTLEKYTKHITTFEEQTQEMQQTCLHYDAKTDTYTILTRYLKDKEVDYIKSIKDLLKSFKTISIAKGDDLYVENIKIEKSEYPELFK